MDESTEPGVEEEGEEPPRSKLPRRKLMLIVGPIVVLAVVGTITNGFSLALAARHPLVLIILEARNRNLILAREVDFWPFLIAATFRRTLTDPLYYLLGRYYGDAAVRWLEIKAGMGSYARMMERIFKKAGYPAVFLFPGAIVCAMAGVTGMRFAVFFVLNLTGTVAAVIVLKAFGDVVAAPVEALLDFSDRNIVVITVVSFVLVGLSVWLGRLEGRMKMSMEDIEDLEREAEADESGETDEGRRPSGDGS